MEPQGISFMRGIVWANGWRWIFILVSAASPFGCSHATFILMHAAASSQEGLVTIVVAFGAYFFIYNYPDTANFLTEKERALIHTRLAADGDATHDERFTWENVARAFKDPKCWLYGFAFHTMSLPLYTFSLFLVRSKKRPFRVLPVLPFEWLTQI